MKRTSWNKGLKGYHSGEKSPMWKGDDAGYSAIHSWIKRKYGKAYRCENGSCLERSLAYEWSLLRGKNYERKIENFWMLCMSCHRKYDLTKKELEFMSNRMRNNMGQYVKI